MEQIDDNSAQNLEPSESLQTVPIYNLDPSPPDGPPVRPLIDTNTLTPTTDGSQTSYVYLKL